jgi:hypothetical protein
MGRLIEDLIQPSVEDWYRAFGWKPPGFMRG